MNQLPTDLQNIIYKYKHNLDFTAVVDKIKNIEYEVNKGVYKSSTRTKKNGEEVQYYDNYDVDDYQDHIENFTEDEVFEHIELEIFSDLGWRKINKEGKQVFYSSVW